jgi:cytoskeletal protein RodZ
MDKQESNETNNSSNVGLLGEYLKQKRIDKNYTIEKLSQKTKISVNILKGLESNDYGHLPSAAYIKGFVTSYVKVLGIPKEEAINKMEYTYLNILGKPFPALNHTKVMTTSSSVTSNTPMKKASEETQTPHDLIESGDSLIESTKSILPLIIFGLVVVLFVGGYKLITSAVDNEVSSSKTKDLGPKFESSAVLVKQPEKVETPVEEKTETTAEAVEETPPVAAVEEKPAEVKVAPVLPRNYPVVEFKKIRTKLFTVQTEAPENNDEYFLPKRIKDAMNSDQQNVYIKAVDGNTWLSYKIDTLPIESVIINKGSDLFLQGDEIRVFLGNVNVTKIFYNNYLISTPTKSGVKSLIFPEESNAKYQLPLFPKANDDILYTSEDYIKRMKLEDEDIAKKKAAQ